MRTGEEGGRGEKEELGGRCGRIIIMNKISKQDLACIEGKHTF